ncbi:MAG: hypothetical protein JRE38_08010 [Deltaproteobacteria bacterium]|nr:hypothetical protein [Deltaproteobacteria bacterium]MBW2692377.1 hypothetical protein [Deltaproteobacteria bacterium]
MSSPTSTPLEEIQVDSENLYLEEVFTDLKVATLRRLTPVKTDGSPDETRPVLFHAQTQLMSQMGPLPVNCAIEATSLEEAMQKFPEAIAEAIERMVEEAKEMQRQEASRIIVPGAAPGGGKIKLS